MLIRRDFRDREQSIFEKRRNFTIKKKTKQNKNGTSSRTQINPGWTDKNQNNVNEKFWSSILEVVPDTGLTLKDPKEDSKNIKIHNANSEIR